MVEPEIVLYYYKQKTKFQLCEELKARDCLNFIYSQFLKFKCQYIRHKLKNYFMEVTKNDEEIV